MMKLDIFVGLFVIFYTFLEVDAHGRVTEPVHRGGAWRKGFKTPINYDDNANYCGGFAVQHQKNKGKCGPCGDDYSLPQPRPNENGGKYGTGLIVKRYTPGQKILIQVEITANHMGHFEFSLCPLNSTTEFETEECFDAHRIILSNGKTEYGPVPGGKLGLFNITAVLPNDLICSRCVLRWHYHCGNNWGVCPDGTGRVGCGPQETFRTCSDISILPE